MKKLEKYFTLIVCIISCLIPICTPLLPVIVECEGLEYVSLTEHERNIYDDYVYYVSYFRYVGTGEKIYLYQVSHPFERIAYIKMCIALMRNKDVNIL
jgi:hypothetical protein